MSTLRSDWFVASLPENSCFLNYCVRLDVYSELLQRDDPADERIADPFFYFMTCPKLDINKSVYQILPISIVFPAVLKLWVSYFILVK